MLSVLWLLACRAELEVGDPPEVPEDTGVSEPAPSYMDPIAVGFEFDGILHADGTLGGYWLEDEYYDPVVFVIFASDDFFSASSEEVETQESCWAWGSWAPGPGAVLTPHDGAQLYSAYEGFLALEWYTCADMLDPEDWGEDGLELVNLFQGMHLGLGFAPLTDELSGAWSEEILDLYGPNMFSAYFAYNGADQAFVAEDLTTAFAWQYDPENSTLVSDELGNLVPEPIDEVTPPALLPEMYVRNVATWYPLFESLDLQSLDADL